MIQTFDKEDVSLSVFLLLLSGYHNAAGGESQVEFFGVKNTQATATTANNGIADANGGWNEIQGVSTASGESIVRSGMAFKSYSEGR